jgi:hypothetical protein
MLRCRPSPTKRSKSRPTRSLLPTSCCRSLPNKPTRKVAQGRPRRSGWSTKRARKARRSPAMPPSKAQATLDADGRQKLAQITEACQDLPKRSTLPPLPSAMRRQAQLDDLNTRIGAAQAQIVKMLGS